MIKSTMFSQLLKVRQRLSTKVLLDLPHSMCPVSGNTEDSVEYDS